MPGRIEFTKEDQNYLTQYIAKYNPLPTGRLGNNIYKILVENEGKKWPWAKRHTWSSWRDHYKHNQEFFDDKIAANQEKVTLSQRQEAEDKMEGGSKATQAKAEVKKPNKPARRLADKRVVDKGEGTSKGPQANRPPSKPTKPKPKPITKVPNPTQTKPRSNVISGKDNADATKPVEKPHSNGNGNASTDSGYASATKIQPKGSTSAKTSNITLTTIPPPHPPSKTSKPNPTKGQQPPLKPVQAEGSFTVTSRQASGTAPTRRIKVDKKREEDVVEDSQAEDDSDSDDESEDDSDTEDDPSTEVKKEPVGKDSHMYDIFGTSPSSSENNKDPPAELPASSAPSSPRYEPMYPNIYDLPEPAASEPNIPGAFGSARSINPSQAPTPPKSNGAGPSSPSGRAPNVHRLPTPVPLSPPVRKLLKRKNVEDDDPFLSSTSAPASPVPLNRDTKKGRPPVLNEGAFRNTFARPRIEGEDDRGKGGSWPPKRRKRDPQESDDDVEMADATKAARIPAPATTIKAPSKKLEPNGKESESAIPAQQVTTSKISLGPPPPLPRHTRPMPRPQHVNAVASSSKVKLPPSSAVPTINHVASTNKPSNVVKPTANSKELQEKEAALRTSAPQVLPAPKKRKIDHQPPANERSLPQTSAPVLPPHEPQALLPQPQPQEPQALAKQISMPPSIEVFYSNPSYTHNGKPLASSGGSNYESNGTGRHVDLREELMKHRMSLLKNPTSLHTSISKGGSVGGSTHSGSKPRELPPKRESDLRAWRLASARSPVPPYDVKPHLSTSTSFSTISGPDMELMSVFKREITMLAESCGFAPHVAEAIYSKLGTLDKTKEVLKKMQSDMKEYLETLKAGDDVEVDRGESEGVPEGVIPKVDKGEVVVKKKRTRRYVGKTPPRMPLVRAVTVVSHQRMVSKSRPNLDYKLLPPGADDYSEYSPPAKTRAGRFIKLQREGREEEAKMALASSGGSLRKSRASGAGSLRLPHSLLTKDELQGSPTPMRREQSSHMDVDEEERHAAADSSLEVALVENEARPLSELENGFESSEVDDLSESQDLEAPSFEADEAEVADEILPEDEDDEKPPQVEVEDDDDMDIYATPSPRVSPARRYAFEHSNEQSAGEPDQADLHHTPNSYSSPARQRGTKEQARSEVILAQDSDGEEDKVEDPFHEPPCSMEDILAWVDQQVEDALAAQDWRKRQLAEQEDKEAEDSFTDGYGSWS